MADQATQTPPAQDMRAVFAEELTRKLDPLAETTRNLETRLSEVGSQLDTLETEVRAAPQMKVSERGAFGSKEDQVLGRSFFREDGNLEKIRQMGGGVPSAGGDIVQRAFSLGLIAGSGTLNAEQSDTFLSLTLDQAQFLQLLDYQPMNAPTKQVSKLSVASRVMRPKTGGVSGPEVDAILGTPLTLTSEEGAVSTRIFFETLEDNIMQGRATNYIQGEFATVFRNDLADLAITGDESLAAAITDTSPADGFDDSNGDSAGDRAFRRQNDGYIRLLQADNTVNDVSGAAMAGDVKGALFPALRNALPQRFRRLMPALLVSHAIRDTYLDQIDNRPTNLGDMVLANGWTVPTWQGFPIIGVDYLPDGAGIFTPLSNLVFGVQRGITFGVDINNVDRYARYGWTVRYDYGVKFGATAVLVTDFAF